MRKALALLVLAATLTVAAASTALAGPYGPIVYLRSAGGPYGPVIELGAGPYGPTIYGTAVPLLPCDRIGRALDGLCWAPMGPYGPIVYGARYGGSSPGLFW